MTEIKMMGGGIEIHLSQIEVDENSTLTLVHGYNAGAINTDDRKREKFQTELWHDQEDRYLTKIKEIRDLNPIVGLNTV